MRSDQSSSVKIVVTFEGRPDGGLRAYSDDVPGFVLSHADPDAVLADVKPALEVMLSHIFGAPVVVEPLSSLREHMGGARADACLQMPPPVQEYVSRVAA